MDTEHATDRYHVYSREFVIERQLIKKELRLAFTRRECHRVGEQVTVALTHKVMSLAQHYANICGMDSTVLLKVKWGYTWTILSTYCPPTRLWSGQLEFRSLYLVDRASFSNSFYFFTNLIHLVFFTILAYLSLHVSDQSVHHQEDQMLNP